MIPSLLTLVVIAIGAILFGPLELGRVAIDYISPLFSLFKDEKVAPTIAVLIVLSASAFLVGLILKIVPLRFDVFRYIKFLKKCKDRQEFLTKFDEFDALMMKSNLLKHCWKEYRETLPTPKTNSTAIEITLRPGDFINRAELEHSGIKLKWFNAIPGIFVGVGLLFTFIGLVAALFFASQAIQAVGGENIDAAQQTARMQGALAQLLGTATFKFWTSIAGLGCSIILGVFHRIGLRSLDKALDDLCIQIERCTRTVTPEMIAVQQLDELREQSSQLKEFTGQLAFNLGKALEDALNNAMPGVITTAMSPLGNGVTDITNSIRELHQEMPNVMNTVMSPIANSLNSLTKNSSEFSSVASERAGAEIKVASNELATVAMALKEASAHITGSSNGLSGQIAEAASDLRTAAKAITVGISGITDNVRADVDRTRNSLEEQLQAATQGLSNAAAVIRASLVDVGGKMRSTTEEAGATFAKQISAAVARIENGTQANTVAVQQALAQLQSMTSTATGSMAAETKSVVAVMRATAEHMAKAVAEITTKIQRGSEEGVAGLTERLVKASEAMQDASNHNSERIGQAVERIIAAGNQAEAGVDGAAKRVAQTMEVQGKQAAARVVSGADQVLTDFKESLDNLGGSIDVLWERLNKITVAMGIIEDRIGSHIQALDGVNRAAKATENSLSASAVTIAEAGRPLNQATQALKASIDDSSHAVAVTAQTLEETHLHSVALAKEMSKTLTELQDIWSEHAKRFDRADENLGRAAEKIIEIVGWNTTRFEEHVEKIDISLADVVGQFAGNIEELEHTAEAFHEAILAFSEFRQSLEKIANRQPNFYR